MMCPFRSSPERVGECLQQHCARWLQGAKCCVDIQVEGALEQIARKLDTISMKALLDFVGEKPKPDKH